MLYRFCVQISALWPAIHHEVFRGFPHCRHIHSVASTWNSVSNIRELVLRTFVPLCVSENTSCYIRTAACHIRGHADKSLAGQGRKQVTATKHGIYSTYSTRSSINFLARCSNLRKSLKKIRKVVRPTRSPRQQWPPRRTKNGDISIVF